MLCPECKQHNVEGFAHCSHCGAALPQPTGPQPARPAGPPAERPTIFTVVAVLGLVSAALNLVGIPTNISNLTSPPETGIPGMASLFADPTYRTFMVTSLVFGAASALLWIAAGIGLLRTKRWAYPLTIALIIYGLASDLVGMPITMGALSRTELPRIAVIMGSVMGLFALLLWGLLLFLLLRRGTREAYHRAAT
jgi:hypothetical protein